MAQSYTDREKKLAAITGLTLGCALLWVTGISPNLTTYRSLSKSLADVRDKVWRQERTNRRNRPYKREHRELEKQLKTADDAEFWEEVEKNLLACNVRLVSYSRSAPERRAKAGYAIVRYSVTVDGELGPMLRVLQRFQDEPAFLRVRSASISTQRNGRKKAVMSVSTLVPIEEGE